MTVLDPILQPLVDSPKLDSYVEQLLLVRQQEREARQRFYNDITEDDKAEFINGQAIFHSPVKIRHSNAGVLLVKLLSSWVDKNDLGFVGFEKIMVELTRNSYEPDICFFNAKKSAKFQPDQMILPAPDFVVEILSPSTEKNDRGIKLEDYAAHGVEEYWIIDPEQEFIEQYVLLGEEYDLRHKLSSGEISAVAVAGFTIPVRAIFDKQENLNALQNLLSQND